MPKNILMIGVTQTAGGVESYIMNLLRTSDRGRFQYFFLKRGEHPIAYEAEIRALGGIVIENCPGRHDITRYIPFYKKLFRETGFDGVYLNTCDIMSYDMLIFAKQAGVPVRVIHAHNSQNMIRQTLYHRLSEQWCRKNLHRYATHYLACGEKAGQWMFDGRPFTVIQNGISTERFRYDAAKRQKVRSALQVEQNHVIGFVGRLSSQKNPQLLVEIFAQYAKTHLDALLLMVGDGELRGETEEAVAVWGLQQRIKLLGARSDIPELMQAMDCFVLPSQFEGFPFVLVEAQASGLPCVVSGNISRECDLTGNMQFVDLDAPIAEWATAIAGAHMPLPRDAYGAILRSLGYDMATEVGKVETILSGEVL